MIYKNWMSFIKDEVLLKNLAIPGSHNACTAGMNASACCQDHDIYTQLNFGIRHFCIRLNTDKKGNIIVCHGLSKGILLKEALKDICRFLEEQPSEFLIIDIREYYDQKIGPFTFHYKADKTKVDEILKETVNPEKYAYTDFQHIKDVTMGAIRKSGKRYMLLNYKKEYDFSVNCEYIFPWEKQINGLHAPEFIKSTLKFFNEFTTEGLFWFQTQLTPNLGVPVGLKSPKKLDEEIRPYFAELLKSIKSNPEYLKKANIIAGDFMCQDYLKACEILKLNLDKNNVKENLIEKYTEGLKWN